MRLTLMFVLSCHSGPAGECVTGTYTPVGPTVSSANECYAEDSGADVCAFTCAGPPACEGAFGVHTCEPCSALEAYMTHDCSSCMTLFDHGFISFSCENY